MCGGGRGFQVFLLGRLREKADLREDGKRVRGWGGGEELLRPSPFCTTIP